MSLASRPFVPIALFAVLVLDGLGCARKSAEPAPAPAPPPEPPQVGLAFTDAGAASGVEFLHESGAEGQLSILEIMGAGVAAFDCDGDGDQDLLFRQSGRIPGAGASTATDRLFRNDIAPGGAWRFVEVTAGSGLDRPAYGMGVATGDYDGDGLVDLYLTNHGANRLLRNRGGCRFDDRTVPAGVGDDRWSTAATFFDMDRDGDLDLFVGNYLDADRANHKRCFQASGAPDYCGPDSFAAVPSRLLRNRGDGTFEDATVASGLALAFGKALGAIAADFDGDARIDLFVANDSTDNHLWLNRGDGTFAESAKVRGVALNAAGVRTGDMGVDADDFDADGDLDLVSTHLSIEGASLWRNDGSGGFWDSAAATGALAGTLGLTGFGARWFDPDLDSNLDLVVANGGVRFIDRLANRGDVRTLEQNLALLRWNAGRYHDAAPEAGAAFAERAVHRGLAVADFDDDGDPDLVVTANNGPARLLRNDLAPTDAWIGLRLLDREGRRDALGAEARLELGNVATLVRRSHTDGSYLSASDPRILFGLAGRPAPTAVAVRWPDGGEERFAAPPPGRYTTLRHRQGSGEAIPAAGEREEPTGGR
jgi:hypothetical protein